MNTRFLLCTFARLALPGIFIFVTVPASAKLRQAADGPVCATPSQAMTIQKEVKAYPGDPIAIAAREQKIPEFAVASGLAADMRVGARIDAKQFETLWKSIDAWGADTMVRLVISPSSEHAFVLYSKVPVIQPGADPGYLDVYADEGRGVNSHIQMSRIAATYATDMPTEDPKFRTRGINFFDHRGHNVIGVYASIKKYDPDPAALAGFEKTRALIAALPKACR